MSKNTIDELQEQVERLVREHLSAQQRALTKAVERAFGTAMVPARSPTVARTSGTRRRRGAELAELADRLFEAVRTCPGETMTTIAAQVGEKPRALNLPMLQLKQAGRVRSAGERNATRYFPMVAQR